MRSIIINLGTRERSLWVILLQALDAQLQDLMKGDFLLF
jgi:hypothetical protein